MGLLSACSGESGGQLTIVAGTVTHENGQPAANLAIIIAASNVRWNSINLLDFSMGEGADVTFTDERGRYAYQYISTNRNVTNITPFGIYTAPELPEFAGCDFLQGIEEGIRNKIDYTIATNHQVVFDLRSYPNATSAELMLSNNTCNRFNSFNSLFRNLNSLPFQAPVWPNAQYTYQIIIKDGAQIIGSYSGEFEVINQSVIIQH